MEYITVFRTVSAFVSVIRTYVIVPHGEGRVDIFGGNPYCISRDHQIVDVCRVLQLFVTDGSLGELVFHVEGVANYVLAAPAADVAVEADVLPRLGSLTVEAMP